MKYIDCNLLFYRKKKKLPVLLIFAASLSKVNYITVMCMLYIIVALHEHTCTVCILVCYMYCVYIGMRFLGIYVQPRLFDVFCFPYRAPECGLSSEGSEGSCLGGEGKMAFSGSGVGDQRRNTKCECIYSAVA